MQTFSLTRLGLWTGLEYWPHRACVDAVVTEMHAQRYSTRTIYHFVQAARRFVAWRSDTMGAGPLGYDEIDRFVVHRRAAGALRNGERKALARLREAMVQAGVMTAPTPAAGPADDILRLFEISLVRRGYRPASVSSYIWFCRPFIVELWDGAEPTSPCRAHRAARWRAQPDHSADYVLAHPRYSEVPVCRGTYRGGSRLRHTCGPSEPVGRTAVVPAPGQVEAVRAACDRSTIAGRRDYAVLILLARLGLRAAEVALLSLDDVDGKPACFAWPVRAAGSPRCPCRRTSARRWRPTSSKAGHCRHPARSSTA